MIDVDLNLLYTLEAFVRTGSLASAARELGRSEPAISARLHKLEQELAVPLFERAGRRLVLTPTGRAVHREAASIVERVRRVHDVTAIQATEPRGRLRIGTLGTVGVYVLPMAVSELVRRHPNVAVEMLPRAGPALVESLLAGSLDIVVSIGVPPDDDRVEVSLLREIRPVVVAPRDLFPASMSLGAEELAKHDLLEWALAEDLFFGKLSAYLSRSGLSDRVRVQVPHIATLKALVRQQAGLAFLPDYTVVDADLRAHSLTEVEVVQPLWCAVRKRAQRPAIEAFKALLEV